jgi:hypothetical protein
VELLDWQIVEMTPIGPGHAGCVDALNRRVRRGESLAALFAPTGTITVADVSWPRA